MATKKPNNKHKAENILELLLTLLQAGEGGIGEDTLQADFGCHPRTLARWRGLLESQADHIRFHVEEGEEDRRWRATLSTRPGGGQATRRDQLVKILQTIYRPFTGDLAALATVAHGAELTPENERVLFKMVDHLVSEEPTHFRYRTREYDGTPLVLVQSADGLYVVVLVFPHKALYTFRLDLIQSLSRVPLEVRRDTGALPDLVALRKKIHAKLGKSANMFINWKDVTPTTIEFRFRNLEKKVLENKCRGAALRQPDPADPTVWDVTMEFSGWMEASKFMKEMLSTYSVRSPKWAATQFIKEISEALEELDEAD